jgi:hypothetical protein
MYSSSYLWPTSYYGSSYYTTGYYPTAYWPSYYASAYYSPTYYSTGYYPSYYSSAYYYPTYYSAAYYPTYYASAYYYPTYYSSAYYYPTYYSSAYYYPSSYSYYPSTYYATGYYLGSADTDTRKAGSATKLATTNRKARGERESRRDRTVIASRAANSDPTRFQSSLDAVDSAAQTELKSPLVRRSGYIQGAGSSIANAAYPPVPGKNPPTGTSGPGTATGAQGGSGARADAPPNPPAATESNKRSGAGAGTASDAAKSGGALPEKKGAKEAAPRKDTEEPLLEPAPPLDGAPTKRDSLRPRYQTQTTRNVLLGRVESDAGEAREGVRVTVSSRNDPGLTRAGESNAYGRFAIRLADGDWTVRVTMPSGRTYPVRQISVQDGRVVDDAEGRDIPDLIISY